MLAQANEKQEGLTIEDVDSVLRTMSKRNTIKVNIDLINYWLDVRLNLMTTNAS